MKDLVTARATLKFEKASAEEVYDAWLNEEDVRAWSIILGTDVNRIEIDARVGGKFLFSDMRDGEEARHWGTYRALERPHLIEFTWFTSEEEEEEYTSIVRIEISRDDSGCSVTVSHTMDAIFTEYIEPTEKGWSTMLGAIDELYDTAFRGVFLTSTNPKETARFYREVVGLPLRAVGSEGKYAYWRLDRKDMQIAIHDAKAFADYTYPPNAESNLTHVYFKISDQERLLSRLERLGVSPLDVDDVVVTIVDPDGRKVMLGTA